MNYAAFARKHLDVRSRSGSEWQCLCPYHDDSSPSFSVNVRKGLFICYACGAKGRIESLAEYLGKGGLRFEQSTSLDEVLDKAKQLRNPPAEKLARVMAPEWLDFYRIDGRYKDFWGLREIAADLVMDYFCLGFDNEESALVIPVHDWNGTERGLIRRYLAPKPDEPRYRYPVGMKISDHLYGAWQVRTHSPVSRPPLLAITEGSIDTLRLWQADVPSVALLGARLSRIQRNYLVKLDPREVVLMTDNDQVGRQAAFEIETALRKTGIMISKPKDWPRHCKDVGDMTDEEIIATVHSRQRV